MDELYAIENQNVHSQNEKKIKMKFKNFKFKKLNEIKSCQHQTLESL